jgi:large subunit ribosomal protein L33
MRESFWMECTSCGERNYRTEKGTPKDKRNAQPTKLELKKYCPKERKHTVHKENKKK